MRKIFIAILLVFLLSSLSHAAVSEDMSVYVRKDVFDAYMQNINSKFDRVFDELKAIRQDMKTMREEIQAETKAIREEVKEIRQDINNLAKVTAVLSERIDSNDKRIGDLRNDIYLGLVVLGIIAAFPVERLIDAKLSVR